MTLSYRPSAQTGAAVLAIVIWLRPTTGSAQDGCYPAPQQLERRAAEVAATETDRMTVLRALDREAGVGPGFLSTNIAINVHSSDALTVAVVPPYWGFRLAVNEAMRTMQPVADVKMPTSVQVLVSPNTIDAPNITRIVLQRAGTMVAPIDNRLGPRVLTTRLGVSVTKGAGTVSFPCSAFLPGQTVILTAIPESGVNLVKSFTDEELVAITGPRP